MTTKININTSGYVYRVGNQAENTTVKLVGNKKNASLVLEFANALRTTSSDQSGLVAFDEIIDGVKNQQGEISFTFSGGRKVIVGNRLYAFSQKVGDTTINSGAAWTAYTAANPIPGPGPTPGQTFTLTTAIETVPASGTMGANSTVSGTLTNGVANGQTFQTGDVINANATSDVNVNLLVDQANVVTINNARSVNFRNLSGGNTAAANTNAILWNGVGTFSSTNSLAGQVGVSNGALATTYAVVNPLIDTGAGLNVTYRAADITGATDTANFSVTGVGSTSNAAVPAPSLLAINNNSTGATATGVEIATVATSGTNNVNLNFGTNTSRVNVTGGGTNTLTMLAGGIVATAQTYNLSGATGANTLDVGATLSTSSTITGGSGADTLRVTPAGLAITNLSVSGVETLRLRNAAVAGTLGFTGTPSFGTIRTDAGGNAGVVVTLLNGLQSTTAINYAGAATAATSGNAQQFNAITATGATTGAADTLNLSLTNGGVNLTNAAPYQLGDLTVNGIENVNVAISDAAAAGVSAINAANGIVSSTLTTFAATGASALTVLLSGQAIGGTGGNNLTTVNFSGITTTTGASVVSTPNAAVLAAASNFTAGAGGLRVVIANVEAATDVLTFTGGAGIDVFDNGAGATSVFTGLLNASLGAGNDIINATASAGVVANGGDGNDLLTGGAAIDTLRGDAGNDTIQGNAAADVLTGGDGADQFNFTTNASIDTVTDFVTGAGSDVAATSIAGLALGSFNADNAATAAAGAVAITTVNVGDVGTTALAAGAANSYQVIALTGANLATLAAAEAALEGASGATNGTGFNITVAANNRLSVVWSDGANSYLGYYTFAATANGNAFAGALTQVATFSGVTSAANFVAGNFAAIA